MTRRMNGCSVAPQDILSNRCEEKRLCLHCLNCLSIFLLHWFMGPGHPSTYPLGTRCCFTWILAEFSQRADLSSCFVFFHRLSFWYTGCSQCGEWLVSGLGEKRVFLQTRNGVFPGNQHSLFVWEDPKSKSEVFVWEQGWNQTVAGSLWTWAVFFFVLSHLQGMHELHVASLLCLGKFQCPCSGNLGHCAARFPWCHNNGEYKSIGLPQAAQKEGGGQSLWASDDFQLCPMQQFPVWVDLGFFFKRPCKFMSSVNHSEKHSFSIISLFRGETYLIIPFFTCCCDL